MSKALVSKALDNPIPLAIGAVLILGVVYYLARKTFSDVADGAGGILSGNNALTEGTAFEDKGALGTLGAGVDAIGGGLFSWLGESASEIVFDWNNAPTPKGEKFLRVIFPGGQAHAVDAFYVQKDGTFLYSGVKYRLGVDQANNRVAVKV